jgi:hypothetical protein
MNFEANIISRLPCSLMLRCTDGNHNSISERELAAHIMGDCPRCSTVAKLLYLEAVLDAIAIVDGAGNAEVTPPKKANK